jgi:hypothetical protein
LHDLYADAAMLLADGCESRLQARAALTAAANNERKP